MSQRTLETAASTAAGGGGIGSILEAHQHQKEGRGEDGGGVRYWLNPCLSKFEKLFIDLYFFLESPELAFSSIQSLQIWETTQEPCVGLTRELNAGIEPFRMAVALVG